jgi:hypothetical protein
VAKQEHGTVAVEDNGAYYRELATPKEQEAVSLISQTALIAAHSKIDRLLISRRLMRNYRKTWQRPGRNITSFSEDIVLLCMQFLFCTAHTIFECYMLTFSRPGDNRVWIQSISRPPGQVVVMSTAGHLVSPPSTAGIMWMLTLMPQIPMTHPDELGKTHFPHGCVQNPALCMKH